MAQNVINIPRINDTPSDFEILFKIWSQINGYEEDVRFDFSRCYFLRPNAVAFLGGLTRLIQYRWGTVEFDWATLRDRILTNLCQSGFAKAFGYPSSGWDGNSIPYRHDDTLDMNGIMDYLTDNWIGKGWVRISNRLRDAIAGNMWEIYNNAFEHSGTEIGVFSCGQYFPWYNALLLSVVDFGQGIPSKVRDFFRQNVSEEQADKLKGSTCLQWAFQAGSTTKVGYGEPGGAGLDLLKQFVKLNKGKLEVYSNDGYCIIDKNGERYSNRTISFEGTVFHITLWCDEKQYHLKGEVAPTF
ncbi:MAG: ATP-binding protein [Nitrospirae bacterium]|nr:ATP-binding protein [Nitrospirota bacterium]